MVVKSMNSDYALLSDNSMAAIINNFSEDTILEIMDQTINSDIITQSLSYGGTYTLPNLVRSYESNYVAVVDNCPPCAKELKLIRTDVYHKIMQKICDYYNLSYIDDGSDPYTLANCMYNFFISDFSSVIISFLTRYILREKNELYKMLESLKEKDGIIIYPASTDEPMDFILINAHTVLNSIFGTDITLTDIIRETFTNEKVAEFLNSHIQDRGDFFKITVKEFVLKNLSMVITNLRLNISGILSTADNQPNINQYLAAL